MLLVSQPFGGGPFEAASCNRQAVVVTAKFFQAALGISQEEAQPRHAAVDRTKPRSLGPGMRIFAWTAARPRVYRRATALARWTLTRLARNGWITRLPTRIRA